MKRKNKHNTGNITKNTQNKSLHPEMLHKQPDRVGELQPQEGGKAVNGEKCEGVK